MEAAESAAMLGADVALLDEPDRRLRCTETLIDRISELLRSFRPTVVVTHWEDDSHPDHQAANDATRRAIVATEGLSRTLRYVLACDTYLGRGRARLFEPDVVVDVSDVWPEKVAAIRAHRSQRPEQYVEAIERQCWLHGARAGVTYAEGFRALPFYGRAGVALTALT